MSLVVVVVVVVVAPISHAIIVQYLVQYRSSILQFSSTGEE